MSNEITDTINAIYDDIGFKGVIEFLENHICGEVEKKEDGLYEVYTMDEGDVSLIWDILQPGCFFSEHYGGHVYEGKYYFIEDPSAEVKITLKHGVD